MLVPTLVLLALLAAAAGIGLGLGRGERSGRAVLDDRLAQGQITAGEHARRMAVLEETRTSTAHRRWYAVVAVIAAAGLLAVLGWAGARTGWNAMGPQMAEHMGGTATDGTADAEDPDAPSFEVVATDLAFAPTTVTVPAGTRVNLTLRNDGSAFHDLTIPELDFTVDAEPGDVTTGSLVVQEAGTYEFVCSVPGHAAAGMRGELVVTAAP